MVLFKGIDLGKIADAVGEGVKVVQEAASNIDVSEIEQGAKKIASTSVDAVTSTIDHFANRNQDPDPEDNNDAAKGFVSLMWLLATVDGEISDDEKVKINELANSIDENSGEYVEEFAHECESKVKSLEADFDTLGAAKVEAQRVLDSMELSKVEAKLVAWNLLVVAMSDGTTSEEADFVRFVAERAGVEGSVFEELKNYGDALGEIEDMRNNLRKLNRPFGEIEPLMTEMAQREQTIIDAAQSLVMDR